MKKLVIVSGSSKIREFPKSYFALDDRWSCNRRCSEVLQK